MPVCFCINKDQSQSLLLTSIVIEMGDVEIQIRRSAKTTESYNRKENVITTPVKSSAIAHQNGEQEKKNSADEKPVWDYSIANGKESNTYQGKSMYQRNHFRSLK